MIARLMYVRAWSGASAIASCASWRASFELPMRASALESRSWASRFVGVGVEYGESPILGVLILTAREDDLSEIDLRMPIFRLEFDGALQFLNGRGPVALSLMT